MISEIRIQGFKSIHDLAFKPGRVTVLIGENGSGKSNILEAIAFAAGAATNKLDNEFLFNRGIRVTDDVWMNSAFPEDGKTNPRSIRLRVKGNNEEPIFDCFVTTQRREEDDSFSGWSVHVPVEQLEVDEALVREEFATEVRTALGKVLNSVEAKDATKKKISELLTAALARSRFSVQKLGKLGEHATTLGLTDFMIYAPENTVLRTPPPESAIQPLGAKGEGLLKLLQSFTEGKFADRLEDMKTRLRLLGWFEDFLAPDKTATAAARLQIRDKWLAEDRAVFDQRSANEGFLYLLFYFTLLMSWRTPRFFALDNVDNALNPKLCSTLMRQITELAKKYEKQVVCTTHNPAILDGLDLHDGEQRLYVVRRDSDGRTVVHRVLPPKLQPGETPVRLSEAFMRGIIGGLPDHF